MRARGRAGARRARRGAAPRDDRREACRRGAAAAGAQRLPRHRGGRPGHDARRRRRQRPGRVRARAAADPGPAAHADAARADRHRAARRRLDLPVRQRHVVPAVAPDPGRVARPGLDRRAAPRGRRRHLRVAARHADALRDLRARGAPALAARPDGVGQHERLGDVHRQRAHDRHAGGVQRRDRAPAHRRAAAPHRAPRRADRAAEPHLLPRPPGPGARRLDAARRGGPADARPRRLQGRQRHARPRLRRRAAAPGRRPAARDGAHRGHRRPARRRRVHRHADPPGGARAGRRGRRQDRLAAQGPRSRSRSRRCSCRRASASRGAPARTATSTR